MHAGRALHPQLRRRLARRDDQFFTDPDGDGPLPAVCDPLLAGRYLCDAIGKRTTSIDRLFADLRFARQPPAADPRPPLHVSQDFAGLGGDVKYLRTARQRGEILAARRRLHLLGWRPKAATSTASRTPRARPGSGPPDRPLLPRRAADPRLRHSRRRPARAAHPVYDADGNPVSPTASRSSTTRSAAGLTISAAPSSKFRSSASSRSWACGRRSSSTSAPLCGARRSPQTSPIPVGQLRCDRRIAARLAAATPTDRSRTSGRCPAARTLVAGIIGRSRSSSSATPPKPARLGRLRRQLELAVRPVQDRFRQGADQGRRGTTPSFTFNVGTAF